MGGVIPLKQFLHSKSLTPTDQQAIPENDVALDGALNEPDETKADSENGLPGGEPGSGETQLTQQISEIDLQEAYERGLKKAESELDTKIRNLSELMHETVAKTADGIENGIVSVCVQILQSVGKDHVSDLLLNKVADELSACLKGSVEQAVRVSGDSDLGARLLSQLSDVGIVAELECAKDGGRLKTDVCQVVAGDTQLEVDLQGWLVELESCLQ